MVKTVVSYQTKKLFTRNSTFYMFKYLLTLVSYYGFTQNPIIHNEPLQIEKYQFESNKRQNAKGVSFYEYKENDNLVRVEDHDPYFVALITGNTNFSKEMIIAKKTENVITEKVEFLKMPYGYQREFNDKGEVVKEVDLEEGFNFKIDDLIDKVKRDFKIDLTTPMKGLVFRKSIAGDPPLYYLYIPMYDGSEEKRLLIFDGNTGNIIENKIGFFEI